MVSNRWRLHAGLLTCWFLVSFGVVFFARDWNLPFANWPLSFWLCAQGSVLCFLAILVVFARRANRRDGDAGNVYPPGFSAYCRRIHIRFSWYVIGLLVLLGALATAEHWGMSKAWVAGIFLFATLLLYAVIGVFGRTAEAPEYYVAGRRVPAMYNGMATAADWMSAASFISLAGGLYLQGFSGTPSQPGGLAYVLGWTGGFCLVAILVAPYLRRMGLYTVPDYFSVRFGGRWPRIIAALAAVLCSFTYVVAQLFGVGLITSRLTGVNFEIGILLGLGGVLLCSFLGGMRAVTWTQVTQYVVIILAFLIPVSWLSYKQTGNPLAAVAYGQQLDKITEFEKTLLAAPAEKEVTDEYARRASSLEFRLRDVDSALQAQREELRKNLRSLVDARADDAQIASLRRELAALPKDASAARDRWSRELQDYQDRARPMAGMPLHATPFSGDPHGTAAEQEEYSTSRLNFMALMFCLMVGTAGLPHVLTRFYTTANVAETRRSVAWSLFFIALLYLSAPALAVLVKYEIMANFVGQPFSDLPNWMLQWARDPSLLTVSDVNGDRTLQFAELNMGPDLIMLATPEIGGLPFVITVLVAAGGLAAALSTADGLLLTIGNALAHDMYFGGDSDKAQAMRRVMWSKFALLVVALIAAYAAASRPAGILFLVSASFSMAASAFVPSMVLGIFWKGMSRNGAVCAMLVGLGVTLYYLVINQTAVRQALGLTGGGLWFGIQPVSAGVFGVGAGLMTAIVASLLMPQKEA